VPGGFIGADKRPWLAIDSQGNPRLGYQDPGSGELIHAVKSAGQWSFTHISTKLTPIQGPGGVAGVTFALHPGRLDPQSRDVGYFVYVDLATDGIGFAHTGGIGPTPVTVQVDTTELTTFADPSVSFDPSENFFVGYVSFFHSGSPQDFVSVRETHVVDIEQGTFSTPEVIEGSQQINVRRPTSIARTCSDGCLAYFDMSSKTSRRADSPASRPSRPTSTISSPPRRRRTGATFAWRIPTPTRSSWRHAAHPAPGRSRPSMR